MQIRNPTLQALAGLWLRYSAATSDLFAVVVVDGALQSEELARLLQLSDGVCVSRLECQQLTLALLREGGREGEEGGGGRKGGREGGRGLSTARSVIHVHVQYDCSLEKI